MQTLTLVLLAGVALAAEAQGGASKGPDPDVTNWSLALGMLWLWIALMGTLFIYTFYRLSISYLRTIACLNSDKQRYFYRPNYAYGLLRRYLLDAPLFRTRHHREFKLSAAINIGTLPSRIQTLFLLGYLGMTILLTVIYIDFKLPIQQVLNLVCTRTGTLAVMNMLPLFLLAGRNNPLIPWTGVSFDTYNLIHRWLGRIVVLEAIAHALSWIIGKEMKGGWKAVAAAEAHGNFILTGTIGVCAFTALLLQSPSAVRHAFYETFLIGHILLAFVAVVTVWIHVQKYPQMMQVMYGVVALWAFDRGARFARLIYRNIGAGGTRAEVVLLQGDAVRINVKMARPWRFEPGQYAYIYMPTIGLWTSHPFTIAWSEEEGRADDIKNANSDPEKGGVTSSSNEILTSGKTTMSFIVRRRTGFTASLYKKAERSGGKFTTTTWLEGPYGHQTLHSYGTVLLFAAGVGITHQVPHVRDLISGYSNGTVAARKVVLVWIIQSPEHLEWIRDWMTEILGLPQRRSILRVLLFVTKPRSMKEIHSPSSSVQMFPGKPNIQSLIDQEVEEGIGAIGVSVCGVGGMADDVRRACRMWQGKASIEFMEESFSW
jgi:predicted ferric reductase